MNHSSAQCALTRSSVCHDSCPSVPWHMSQCAMICSSLCHALFLYAMTHSLGDTTHPGIPDSNFYHDAFKDVSRRI
eukprot:CAMPEP_0179454698 /NCGR_PEP_ID=MMETSP0799-20121207/38599_1 /TAXON_ID=46947 /ORGANISM="Geminigera cryophila, Strain CCMP2564" /LENGTH=75 /DNA_ID=CAMNT_0021252911 /DNA_START=122 /DNA_END=349 /DNA_ORIENTATION=+